MPGIYRYGINHLKQMLQPLVAKGLRSVLLFGVINDEMKVMKIFDLFKFNLYNLDRKVKL